MPHPPTSPDAEMGRARALVAEIEGVIWEADAGSMTFTFVSEGVRNLLGYDPAEWLVDAGFWADRLHPDDRSVVIERFVRVASSGGRFDDEYRFLAKDGAWVKLRDLGHAVQDVDGKPVTVRGLMVAVAPATAEEERTDATEDRFQRVVEQLPAIVYLESVQRDPEEAGRMLYISPQVTTLLGFSPQEWMRDPVAWARQFHQDDRARIREEYERVERTGQPFQAVYRMYARDGSIRWFRDEAVLVRDANGVPLYWQGIMFDVTSERASEDRARESEDRYRVVIEHLPAIVYSEDVTGSGLQLVYINSRVEEMLGITPEEWIADPNIWLRQMHPDDRPAVEAEDRRTERSGEPFVAEYRMIARDGRVLWFHDRSVLVRDALGEPSFWQGVMIDVTDRHEAEAQLAEAEERFRALVEQIPVIVYIDPVDEGPTTYISPQTTTVLGYTPEEWYANADLWSRMVHPDDRTALDAETEVDEPKPALYRLIAKDGRTVWVHDQSRLIHDEAGNPLYWQGVLVDVTEQRRAHELERDLERERLEAERLRAEDEMKTTFLQAVSHDLRTPLAAILGLALTLERDDVDLSRDESHDLAHRIGQDARKLDGMVSDFLDLERLNRGLARPAYEPVDIGGMIRELVANSELVTERRLALDVAPATVHADAAMIERIVENLLGNTAKHTPGDSRIWVRIEREEDGVLLVVEDDGPGVPVEDRERIFEPYRQGIGAAAGSGVGLTLVRRFAELHDGTAWVEERPGGGASFRVRLAWTPDERVQNLDTEDQPTGAASPDAPA
jgi:PAS domain S-box-containing protein